MPPSQWKGVALDQLTVGACSFLSARLERVSSQRYAELSARKLRQTVDSQRIFLVQTRHNRCSDQSVTEDRVGAVAGVQMNRLVRLWEDYYVGKTK